MGTLLGTQSGQTNTQPKAYINWVFFDEQFNYAGGGFDKVGSNGVVKSHSNLMIALPKNGYVFVYCSNESSHYVYFDELKLIHHQGQIMEETHYYPFGLTMAGTSSNALEKLDNRHEYKGEENKRSSVMAVDSNSMTMVQGCMINKSEDGM